LETNYTKVFNNIQQKRSPIAIIGLGYVGLPIALSFAKYFQVIGFDINAEKIKQLKHKQDPTGEIPSENFENINIIFSDNANMLKEAQVFIVTVPTPIDIYQKPDLTALFSASMIVGKFLKKNDVVIYESTVYPGCTEEDCVPILEEVSALKFNQDFFIGYSPERINPGDEEHFFENIVKVVAASSEESLELISKLYGKVVKAGIFQAKSIKVAEAAKIIENTQRDLNIALMNELSMIFDKMQINTFEVLEAAGTKWNFLNFSPGLVGGHCIGVDPYYLTHKANELGISPKVILSGRGINDHMGVYIAHKTIQLILQNNSNPQNLNVLVMGVTFKENVKDVRNSRVIDIIEEIKKFNIKVDIIDCWADEDFLVKEHNLTLIPEVKEKYNAIIVAVKHQEYLNLTEEYFQNLLKNQEGVLVDVKGTYREKIQYLTYWSL